ncbi:hypothetical protein [Intrasporangium sp.]|uniref:hypothetical protein n=1 Tax=Intrasporangium sp. TaxID=1925024 RepID=UPI002D77F683|nr:hypothetical protein [Intrasporangium sp.]
MVLLTTALTMGLAGCVAPAFDSGAFQANARAAAGSARSEVRTVALALRARLEDRVTQAYVNTVVTESESALGPIEDSFGVVDPPSRRDDALRERVVTLLQDAATALTTARIAVRRQDDARLRSSVGELARLGDSLDQLEQDLQ